MRLLAKIATILSMGFMIVAPLSMTAQDKAIKRKVAIGRFSNETQYAKGHSASGEFYGKTYHYFYLDNWKYWIMDKRPEDCNLINREDHTGK
jgi:hypothetical protein